MSTGAHNSMAKNVQEMSVIISMNLAIGHTSDLPVCCSEHREDTEYSWPGPLCFLLNPTQDKSDKLQRLFLPILNRLGNNSERKLGRQGNWLEYSQSIPYFCETTCHL